MTGQHQETSQSRSSCQPHRIPRPRARPTGPVAQRLEQPTHNRQVPGSNPGGPTTIIPRPIRILGLYHFRKTKLRKCLHSGYISPFFLFFRDNGKLIFFRDNGRLIHPFNGATIMSFDISSHTLPIDEKLVDKLVPAKKYFMATELYPITSIPMFSGVGVYAIHLDSSADTIYKDVLTDDYPIYVGKAVPAGSRQGKSTTSTRQLRNRLLEHKRSIEQDDLPVEHFKCRFMIMTGIGEDLIPAMESTLIRMFQPLWNSHIDGFGIHTPGAGRLNQQPSEWDTLHPGRDSAKDLTGASRDKNKIVQKIKSYQMRKVE